MGIVGRFLQAAAIIMLILPAAFFGVGLLAPSQIRSDVQAEIHAPAARTWQVLTDWHLLTRDADPKTGLPKVGPRTIAGGGELAQGKVVRYPLPGGSTWDQLITDWQPPRRYAFRNAAGGRGGLLPGDVEMSFTLAPLGTDRTNVDFQMAVTSHGPFNRAVAFLFGGSLGTLRGYQKLILDDLAHEVAS